VLPPLNFSGCHSGQSANTKRGLEGRNDAQTGIPGGIPPGAMCVQRFDDSRNSAIHITYRISLRSSSMPEPRDPLLKVLTCFFKPLRRLMIEIFGTFGGRTAPPGAGRRSM
jgi:hypothetical protein